MKKLDEIYATLDQFQNKYGMPVVGAPQGSEMWYRLKLGVISASNAHKAIAKKDSETRLTYMAELVAQVATGLMEEINTKYTNWGHDHENAARSSYEFMTGNMVTQLPFVFKDDTFRIGCSPDGIVSENKGVEIKCPFNSVHFVKFLTDDRIKGEYQSQCQFTLWVMGADAWDFVQYDPRMKKNPIKVLVVERDEDYMQKFDELVPAFISDMDKMLARAGFEFGEHWMRLAADMAGVA